MLKHRFQILNLWRPISRPALDWPLALCDFRSADPVNDVLPVALIYPDREGETYGVKFNPNHKWMYFSAVTPEECILIKWCVLHSFVRIVSSLVSKVTTLFRTGGERRIHFNFAYGLTFSAVSHSSLLIPRSVTQPLRKVLRSASP
jgi:hypothetical protein